MKHLKISLILCVAMLLTAVSCTNLGLETYKKVTITASDATYPDAPTLTIVVEGNMKPDEFVLEYHIDGKPVKKDKVFLECYKEYIYTMQQLKPGSYTLKTMLGKETSGKTMYIYEKTQNLNIR